MHSNITDAEFFNLPSSPSLKELEKSYRKFALIMHPDKYGNDEWSKKAFQRLLNRYERFRAIITSANK